MFLWIVLRLVGGVEWTSAWERVSQARAVIRELIYALDHKLFEDPSWRGIEEFPGAFRRKTVMELAAGQGDPNAAEA